MFGSQWLLFWINDCCESCWQSVVSAVVVSEMLAVSGDLRGDLVAVSGDFLTMFGSD